MELYRITFEGGNWETVLTKNLSRAIARAEKREGRKIVKVEVEKDSRQDRSKMVYNSRMFG